MSRANMDKNPDEVAAMFDGVAKRYDLVNDLLSLGQTKSWRRATTKIIAPRPGMKILDLAAGTGSSSEPLAAAGADVQVSQHSATGAARFVRLGQGTQGRSMLRGPRGSGDAARHADSGTFLANYGGLFGITDAVARAHAMWPARTVHVECDRLDQVLPGRIHHLAEAQHDEGQSGAALEAAAMSPSQPGAQGQPHGAGNGAGTRRTGAAAPGSAGRRAPARSAHRGRGG